MSLVPTRDTKRLLGARTREYQSQLAGSPGQRYLEQRGITSEAQSYFHLGFVESPSPEEKGYLHRISIPYIAGKDVVGIKYRVIDSREPRYLSSVGFEARRIFNPNILRGLYKTIYVCEGELDAITLHLLSVPAIAIPGANSWNPIASRALRNRRVVVLADGDDAGQSIKFARQVLSSVDDGGMVVMEGTDVNQFYLDHGSEKLLEYIGYTTP